MGSRGPGPVAEKHPSRGKKQQERIPFSYTAIRSSQAVGSVAPSLVPSARSAGAAIHEGPKGNRGSTPGNGQSPDEFTVNLGNYPILSLELCEMGSYDEKGGYKSVGGISLLPQDLKILLRGANMNMREASKTARS